MPLPEHLQPGHLRAGVVASLRPAGDEEHRAALAATLDDALTRLDLRTDLLDAWRDRLPRLPVPPAPDTLQQTVQAARARLRTEREAADRTELVARRFVVAHLREGLR